MPLPLRNMLYFCFLVFFGAWSGSRPRFFPGACGALGSPHGIGPRTYNNIDPYLSASPWYRPRPLRIPGVRVTHRLTVRLLVRTLHSGHRSGGMKYAGPLRGTPRPLGASAERSERAPHPAQCGALNGRDVGTCLNLFAGSNESAGTARLFEEALLSPVRTEA